MSEMLDEKKGEVLRGTFSDQPDLMIAMIKGANVTSDPTTQTLTDREMMGNAFVYLMAGHETTANSIHFCLVCLALHVASNATSTPSSTARPPSRGTTIVISRSS